MRKQNLGIDEEGFHLIIGFFSFARASTVPPGTCTFKFLNLPYGLNTLARLQRCVTVIPLNETL